MQSFIQGVLDGACDFEQQQSSCKAKRWRVSAGAYQWEHVSAGAYQQERVYAGAYRLARISGNVYLFVFSAVFCGAVIPHFLLRFLEDSA